MRVLAVILAIAVTGCSFFLTSGPSDDQPRRTYPSCTTSNTWPIVDTVFAAIFLSAMVGAISEDDDRETSIDDNEASKAEKITSAALFTGLTGVSAYLGYKRVSACRGARKEFQATNGYGYRGAYPYGAYPGQQPYPAQPQSYPGQQPAQPQPYPGQYPAPYPGQAQPQPYPSQPAAAPQPQPPAGSQPTAVPSVLGTEGDVCASNDECAPGLACTANVCKRPPAR